jgi:hypothetical protein
MAINANFQVPFLPQEGITQQILSAIQLANQQHAQNIANQQNQAELAVKIPYYQAQTQDIMQQVAQRQQQAEFMRQLLHDTYAPVGASTLSTAPKPSTPDATVSTPLIQSAVPAAVSQASIPQVLSQPVAPGDSATNPAIIGNLTGPASGRVNDSHIGSAKTSADGTVTAPPTSVEQYQNNAIPTIDPSKSRIANQVEAEKQTYSMNSEESARMDSALKAFKVSLLSGKPDYNIFDNTIKEILADREQKFKDAPELKVPTNQAGVLAVYKQPTNSKNPIFVGYTSDETKSRVVSDPTDPRYNTTIMVDSLGRQVSNTGTRELNASLLPTNTTTTEPTQLGDGTFVPITKTKTESKALPGQGGGGGSSISVGAPLVGADGQQIQGPRAPELQAKIIQMTKPYQDLVDKAKQAEGWVKNPSAEGDNALTLAFADAIKPDKGFRLTNTEIHMFTGARGTAGDLDAFVQRKINGEALTPEQRADMNRIIQDRATKAQTQIQSINDQMTHPLRTSSVNSESVPGLVIH